MPAEAVRARREGLYTITALRTFRKTPGVLFDAVPLGGLSPVRAIDRVLHARGAQSPGPAEGLPRPWYMHRGQEDNLIVLAGYRDVELWREGSRAAFRIGPERIEGDGSVLFDEAVMLSWPTGVFHRIISSPEAGSASINLAVRHPWFDLRTEFNVYDLDPGTGSFRVVREGHLDQPGGTAFPPTRA
jgi:hypothetical protein